MQKFRENEKVFIKNHPKRIGNVVSQRKLNTQDDLEPFKSVHLSR